MDMIGRAGGLHGGVAAPTLSSGHTTRPTGLISHTGWGIAYPKTPPSILKFISRRFSGDNMVTIYDPATGTEYTIDNEVELGKTRLEVETDNGLLYVNISSGFIEGEKAYKDADWLAKMYVVQNKTMKEIADICNVTPMTINLWLNRLGIETRRRGRRTAPND